MASNTVCRHVFVNVIHRTNLIKAPHPWRMRPCTALLYCLLRRTVVGGPNSHCHWLGPLVSSCRHHRRQHETPTPRTRPRRSPPANREPYMVSAAHHTRATHAPLCLPACLCNAAACRAWETCAALLLLLLLVLGVHVVLAEAPQHREQDALAAVRDDLGHEAAEEEARDSVLGDDGTHR